MVHYHYSLSLFIIATIYLLFIIVEEANNEFRSFYLQSQSNKVEHYCQQLHSCTPLTYIETE